MYFKCKSCGSNEYSIKKDQVLCNYCGSSYFYEQKSEEQESKNGLLIPILLFGLVVGIFIYISIGEDKSKITKENSTTISYTPISPINIDNTNAQIGTQVINVNSNKSSKPDRISGKVVHHTKIENDKHTDSSIGYFKNEQGNIVKATMLPRPKILFDSKGNMIVKNKNRNLLEQKVERYTDENGLLTTVVTTSGFNKKENRVYLDKNAVAPLLGGSQLPSGIISKVKLSKDATKLFYISRYDFLYIVDIKDINKPKVLSKIELTNISDLALSKDENRLYLNSRDEIAIFDISDKTAPKKLGSLSSKSYYKGMVLSFDEKSLYIVKYNDKKKPTRLAQIDITNPSNPKEKLVLDLKDNLSSLVKNEDKIYINHSAMSSYISRLDRDNKLQTIDTPFATISKITLFNNYILLQESFGDIALLKDNFNHIKKINHLDTQGAWHYFYKYIRDLEVTPNGKYLAFIVNKNSISFKRFDMILPTTDEDSKYNKDDYFGNYYTAVIEPDIDKIKEIIISTDGTKLFAFSSSDLFVYDISQLK
jgi:hypothetical protein